MTSELEWRGEESAESVSVSGTQRVPRQVARQLLSSTSALGAGVLIERACSFIANLLAARLGGASTFGAYSLGIATANNIGTYAAGGIGATATRFSGKYPRGSPAYGTLTKALSIVSLVSAGLAGIALWAGAGPIAALLHKPAFVILLRWAAISAVGMILLECCRGFLVGQHRLAALVVLSVTFGVGMLATLPFASHLGAVPMICAQGAVTLTAVLVCLALYRPLGLNSPGAKLDTDAVPDTDAVVAPAFGTPRPASLGLMLREIWSYGVVQLAGLVGLNAAGWWLTSLVARADSSMIQMGLFAIASQSRNIVGLAPGLLAESSLAFMTEGNEIRRDPNQVMSACTFVATVASLLLAGAAILAAPWGIALLYGRTYSAAPAAAAVALATAIIHMGNAPTAGRLTIVSLRATGIINTIWAVLVALSATLFLFHGGNAWRATVIYLCTHLLSAALVLGFLRAKGHIPSGTIPTFAIGSSAAFLLAALATWRQHDPAATPSITLWMGAVYLSGLAALLLVGRRHHWIPDIQSLRHALARRFGREAAPVLLSGEALSASETSPLPESLLGPQSLAGSKSLIRQSWELPLPLDASYFTGSGGSSRQKLKMLAYVHLRNIHNSTGAGRVARQLTENLALRPDVELAILADRQDYDRIVPAVGAPWSNFSYRFMQAETSRQQARWFLLNSPAAEDYWADAQLVFCTGESYVPKKAARLAVTVHDAAYFEVHAHQQDRRFLQQKLKWRLLYGKLARKADMFHTVSHFSAQRLAHFFPGIASRIRVVHNAVTPVFFGQVSPEGTAYIEAAGLANRPFVLVPGGLHFRKNAELILNTWPLLRSKFPDLVLAVVNHSDPAYAARAKSLPGDVRLLGFVSDAALHALYSAARVVWFPSRYEGFGMPVLEAMASGTPVVASRSSSIPEIAGADALLVAPDNPSEHVDAISELLRNDAAHSDLVRRGIERAHTFTWPKAAAELKAHFDSLL